MKTPVLILDNDLDFLELIHILLKDTHEVYTFADVNEMIGFASKKPSICIFDCKLDKVIGVNGVDVMRKVKAINPLCHFGFMSAVDDPSMLRLIMNEQCGAFFVLKDGTAFMAEMVTKIDEAIELMRCKLEYAQKELERKRNLKTIVADTLKVLDSK